MLMRASILVSLLVLYIQADTSSVHRLGEKQNKMEEEQKSKWQECVNMTGEEARVIIEKERPDLNIEVMKDNQPATMDYREDRVRIVVHHDTGLVVMPPHTG